MQNISPQLAGKLITELPSKRSTGESGAGQAAGDTVQPPALLCCAQTLRSSAGSLPSTPPVLLLH